MQKRYLKKKQNKLLKYPQAFAKEIKNISFVFIRNITRAVCLHMIPAALR